MAISRDDVRNIASLARLELSPEEEELHAEQLSRIIDWVDQLTAFEGSDEGHYRELDSLERRDVPRAEDQEQVGGDDVVSPADFLYNAPEALDTLLLVPQVKVVGDD